MRLAPALITLLILATCNSSPPAAAPTSNPAADRWRPEQGASWQIQFTGEIDTGLEVDAYFLDLYETSAAQVAALHAQGRRAVCYFSAGSWEDWRPDAGDFPEEIIGNDYEGWPGERWLDVGDLEALGPIMSARLDLCAAKGFDGADPDNVDGVFNDTGFDISVEEQLAFNRWLAAEAHARGLAIGLKNAPELAARLAPDFDWALTESCFAQGWCADLATFLDAGKPLFAIEYTDDGTTPGDFCAPAAALGASAILKARELDAWVADCN